MLGASTHRHFRSATEPAGLALAKQADSGDTGDIIRWENPFCSGSAPCGQEQSMAESGGARDRHMHRLRLQSASRRCSRKSTEEHAGKNGREMGRCFRQVFKEAD